MVKDNCLFNTHIYLIRHAESIKNLKDVHGGTGMSLTERGRQQALNIERRLASYGINNSNALMFFPNSVQTKETANIILQNLDIPVLEIQNFKTLDMGVASGLSNEEVRQRVPSVYLSLNDWRNKRIDISELKIDRMENPAHFYARGLDMLKNVQENKHNIFVVTTSLYIVLSHILLGNTVDSGGGYIHLNIANAQQTCFIKCGNDYKLDPEKSDVQDIVDIAIKKKAVLV